MAVSAADVLGHRANLGYGFESVHCSGKPPLDFSVNRVYWAGFSDYTKRLLSVDYLLTSGADYPLSVNIVAATASNGVVTATLPDATMVPAGGSAPATVTYSVGAGVGSFRSLLYATAEDACGDLYSYPEPYPGA